MVTADDVRRVGLALPRSYEFFTGGRAKLKVRQIVYAGFSRDETQMAHGDLRYQCETARLDRGTRSGRRSARLSKPRDRACEVAMGASKPGEVTLGGGLCPVVTRRLLRNAVLAHLRSHPTPKPPAAVEVRDGQLYRWSR